MNSLTTFEHFFAKAILKEHFTEKRALFLNQLLKDSNEGHLCVCSNDAPTFPDSILQEGKEPHPKAYIIRNENRYYLQKNWVLETHILQCIQRLNKQKPFSIESLELDEKLLPAQKEAIMYANEHCFSCFSGGPGTGKTFTATCLAKALAKSAKKEPFIITLAAPTGKAASHLSEVLGPIDAQVQTTTLHRLLNIKPMKSNLFLEEKIDADLIIVDEASMIDVFLLAKLLESVSDTSRLVLMGDPNQLPPVETGGLFSEMASLFGVELQRSMRTENNHLIALAENIKCNEQIDSSYLLDCPFDESLIQRLYEKAAPCISWEKPDFEKCLELLGQFRILGALRKGPFGTEAINAQIVEKLSKDIQPGQWWAIPIMITSNAPTLDLYNGSCGILIGQSEEGFTFRHSIAYFPQPIRFSELPPFEIAFCLSVHKSQGSEFEHVLALFPQGSENFGREALYTAVTRAKKSVQIIADEKILTEMCKKQFSSVSGFTKRMCKEN